MDEHYVSGSGWLSLTRPQMPGSGRGHDGDRVTRTSRERRSRDRPPLDAQRQARGGDRVLSAEPGLVHSFQRHREVADRYCNRRKTPPLEIWKFNRQVRLIPAGGTLRIQAASSFRLHWTCGEWQHAQDTDSTSILTGHHYVDIRLPPTQRAPVRFTFFWTAVGRWEGRDFKVGIE